MHSCDCQMVFCRDSSLWLRSLNRFSGACYTVVIFDRALIRFSCTGSFNSLNPSSGYSPFLHNSRAVSRRVEGLHKSTIGVAVGYSIHFDRSRPGMAFLNKRFNCSFLLSVTASIVSCLWAVSFATWAPSFVASSASESSGSTAAKFGVEYARNAFCFRFTRKFSGLSFFGSNFSCSNISNNTFRTCRLQKWFHKASKLRSIFFRVAFSKFWWNRRALLRKGNCRKFACCAWLTAVTVT